MACEKIIKIHKKVLEISKFNCYMKRVDLSNPNFVFTLSKDPLELDLSYIEYIDYDRVLVTDKRIEYYPEIGSMEEIIEYNGWDELLNL